MKIILMLLEVLNTKNIHPMQHAMTMMMSFDVFRLTLP
jgi:hypothetical protein